MLEVFSVGFQRLPDAHGTIVARVSGLAFHDLCPGRQFADDEMKIGTPLSPGALRVMLLGAGELGKEVIIALQRLGVEVIAVDRYENAPGHQVAHRAHVIDMTDGAALRKLVEQEKPHLIVPEIEAIATDMLVEIEAEGLAEVIPTARAAKLTMNREGIRRLAAEELGLPTSPYRFADSLAELQAAIDGGVEPGSATRASSSR
jgi:phosphoribosylglycinamide formyltransferase 2